MRTGNAFVGVKGEDEPATFQQMHIAGECGDVSQPMLGYKSRSAGLAEVLQRRDQLETVGTVEAGEWTVQDDQARILR